MSRISSTFLDLKSGNKKALVGYIVIGDPDMQSSLSVMNLMVSQGVNLLELGVAFSDPMAEGPVIQRAHERALESKTTLAKTINLVKGFREKNNTTPIILMGYSNTFECMGINKFCKLASKCGVDGVLLVDMPPEESLLLSKEANKFDLDIIRLISPNTSKERIKQICTQASGYIYYISLKGITGADSLDVEDVRKKIGILKEVTNLPIVIGFGIKDGVMVRKVRDLADGVVVGSALVEIISEGKKDMDLKLNEKLKDLIASLNAN